MKVDRSRLAVIVCAVVYALALVPSPTCAAEAQGLPEGLSGFRGLLGGSIVSKADAGLVLKVERVLRLWRGNKAKNPDSAVGKELTLAINTELRWSKRLVETLKGFKVGDGVEVGALHLGGDKLQVGEVLRKASTLPAGIQSFRGILVGTIKSKAESSFVLKVDKVEKVWKGSRATDPKVAAGKDLTLVLRSRRGRPNPHLETLRGLKVADRVAAGALHSGADQLDLVEVLRKVD